MDARKKGSQEEMDTTQILCQRKIHRDGNHGLARGLENSIPLSIDS
jgi:hypothetical protein